MKKLFIIVWIIFGMISMITIIKIPKEKVLKTNLVLENTTGIKNKTVYLLDNNQYLVEVDVFIENTSVEKTVYNIIEYLKKTNTNMDHNFNGYIPEKTKIIEQSLDNKVLSLNLSKDFLKTNNLEQTISGMVHSLIDSKSIEKIKLKIEGESIKGYENDLDEDFPINLENKIMNRNNIQKVVVYYNELLNDEEYYLPVTKYISDDREKIDIIMDELKDNIPTNLISYLNPKVEMINYEEENNVFMIDLNEKIIDDKKEEVLNTIAYSVFSNYDISSVLFKVNGKIDKLISKDG